MRLACSVLGYDDKLDVATKAKKKRKKDRFLFHCILSKYTNRSHFCISVVCLLYVVLNLESMDAVFEGANYAI